jgi:hypothetical protein
MIQDVLVIILIVAAISNVIYQSVKLMARRKRGQMACGGCSECELKKNILSQKSSGRSLTMIT